MVKNRKAKVDGSPTQGISITISRKLYRRLSTRARRQKKSFSRVLCEALEKELHHATT